jgi:thiol-disulfide isomerase/thioredoxin
MFTKRFLLSGILILAVTLTACAGATPTPDKAMKDTPAVMADTAKMSTAEAMAADKMSQTPTPEAAMMDKGADKMGTPSAMDKGADKMGTPDAMDKGADKMGTPDAMDKGADKMGTPSAMDKGVDKMGTPDAMMDGKMSDVILSASLANVVDGTAFSLTGFKGKVVLVETMAVWCPTCLQQQKQVAALHKTLAGNPDWTSVSLDIDPNEDAALLKSYIQKNGFDWQYAVASPALSREISAVLGPNFLNPPSAPMFIIDRKGGLHPLPFGVKSAADLQKALEPFLKG